MTRGEKYRHYAAECLRLAGSSENVLEKDLLLQMAEQWRQLAARIEQEKTKN